MYYCQVFMIIDRQSKSDHSACCPTLSWVIPVNPIPQSSSQKTLFSYPITEITEAIVNDKFVNINTLQWWKPKILRMLGIMGKLPATGKQ